MRQRSVVSSFICKPAHSPDGLTVAIFKRSQVVSSYCGKWAACSGSIDSTDQTPESAARREIEEETTLTDTDISLLRQGKSFSFVDEKLQTEWTIYPFAFLLHDGAKNIQIDWEHTEYRFIRPNELQYYDTVPHLQQSLSRALVSPETEAGLTALREDHQNGAGVLAVMALETLLKTVRANDLKWVSTAEEFWRELRMVAWHLAKNGRPSMGAAIEAALFKALDTIRVQLHKPTSVTFHESDTISGIGLPTLKAVAETAIEARIAARRQSLDALGKSFNKFIVDAEAHKRGEEMSTTAIVALSSSTTVIKCFTDLIWCSVANEMNVRFCILESRPMFEGVAFTNALLDSLEKEQSVRGNLPDVFSRLQLEIVSDASVAMVVKTADYVVMGVDKVSSKGDVSNKIGSLTTAIVAKTLRPTCKVVVVFETDKITGAGDDVESNKIEYNDETEITNAWPPGYTTALRENRGKGYKVEVKNAYFEWVPATYIDQYISEEGLLTTQDIAKLSMEKEELEKRIFGDL